MSQKEIFEKQQKIFEKQKEINKRLEENREREKKLEQNEEIIIIQKKCGGSRKGGSVKNNFKEFNNTNNGVIYFDNILKGGVRVDNVGYSYEGLDVAKLNTSIEKYKNYIEENSKNFTDNEFISDLVFTYRGKPANFKDRYKDNGMDDELETEILKNSDVDNYHNETITLKRNINCFYDIKDIKKSPAGQTEEDILDFSYYDYNKNIIQAYEKNYIDNIENLKAFIKTQEEHIEKMSLYDKVTINDYTKKYAFKLYWTLFNVYGGDATKRAKLANGEWLTEEYYGNIDYAFNDKKDEDRLKYTVFGFGDSYYNQIHEIIGHEEFRNKLIEHEIIDSDFVFKDMEEYWKKTVNRRPYTEISIFRYLPAGTWLLVLERFIVDIMIILNKAPPTDTDIYCYRGSSVDYLVPNDKTTATMITTGACAVTEENTFIALRFGSFAINYNSSKPYATAVMYRSKIAKGVRVLYIQPLSFASHEYEILHNIFASFTVNGKAQIAYNNKDNKYGILSNENDSFKSADISLNGYIQPTTIDVKEVIKAAASHKSSGEKVFEGIINLYNKLEAEAARINPDYASRVYGGRKNKKYFKK